jgi:hypothetical protein
MLELSVRQSIEFEACAAIAGRKKYDLKVARPRNGRSRRPLASSARPNAPPARASTGLDAFPRGYATIASRIAGNSSRSTTVLFPLGTLLDAPFPTLNCRLSARGW